MYSLFPVLEILNKLKAIWDWTASKDYEKLGGFAPGDYRTRIFWDFTYTDASGINRNVSFSSEICFTVL